MKEMEKHLQVHKNIFSEENVMILFDYNADIMIERVNGKLIGNVIMMPEFCAMIKSILILLEKGNLKMSDGENSFNSYFWS